MADAPALKRPPAPRARARRADPTVRRQDLLKVTLSCLARLGPRGTTGREICRQAGVSHGLLRHYFHNPDNLLLETYSQLCDGFLERFEQQLGPPEIAPWKALDGVFAMLFDEEWASADVLGAWMAFWTMVRSSPEFRAASDDYNRRLRALLLRCAGRLPEDRRAADLEDAVALLSAVMDGLWLDFCLAPDRIGRADAVALCGAAARRLLVR